MSPLDCDLHNKRIYMRKTILVAILLVVVSCLFGNSALAASTANVKTHIVKHALELGIDPALALSIAKTESGFCHDKKSRHGAVGVFQLMPSTAKKLGYNPYYLNENIKGGLTYYKMMYNKFGSVELALAAYNAGPGNVRKYGGVPPFAETKKFVRTIMNEYNSQKVNPDPAIQNAKGNGAKAVVSSAGSVNTIQHGIKPATNAARASLNPLPQNSLEDMDNIMPEKVLSLYAKQKSNIVN